MLDMGWTEILVIGVVALIVVGPKDLPRMMRTVGQQVGKLRGMAREFQRSMDEAAREADLEEFKDIKNTLNDVRAVQRDAKSAITKGLAKIDRDIDKSVDLKTEDIYEEAPKAAPARSDEPVRTMPSDPPVVTPVQPASADTAVEPTSESRAEPKDEVAAPALGAEAKRASGA